MSRDANHRVGPPPRAERLLRWSLGSEDRAAVLGDLEEEFATIAETRGVGAAARWYWRQTLRSLIPNYALRAARVWRAWRQVQDVEDLARRRRNRVFALWMVAFGVVLAAIAWRVTSDPMSFLVLAPFALLGLWCLASSAFRANRRPRRLSSNVRDRVTGFLWVGLAATRIVSPRPPIDLLILAVVTIVQLWPERFWPGLARVRRLTRREYWVRTPVLWYGDRDNDPYLTTVVPAVALAMSHPIVGRSVPAPDPAVGALPAAAPMKTLIERTFRRSDTIRLFAAVNGRPDDIRAELTVLNASGRVMTTTPVPVAPATCRRQINRYGALTEELPLDPAAETSLGQIDVTVPLANLEPGRYCLRLTALDEFDRNHRDTQIVVAADG